ncbi:MAG: glycosyltransferase family 39 protein [Planctomycetota bacterium]|nr:glycosyltransferase family 39 protein [Planctomycetota bacterium]
MRHAARMPRRVKRAASPESGRMAEGSGDAERGSTGATAAAVPWPTEDSRAPRAGVLDVLLLPAILTLNAVVLVVKGTERFEFFDMSAFLDAGYRVAIGQQPYVDFYYTAGPVHLYLHALSFLLFGFTKTAVMVHLCAVGLAATAISYVIARLRLKPVLAALIAILTLFSFYGPICHPWYDQNASIWLLLGILLWELRARFWTEHALPRVAFACGVLTGLSLLTKANVGLAGGALFVALFLAGPGKRRSVAAYVLGGVVSVGVMLLMLHKPSYLIDQNFFAYAPAKRLKAFARLQDVAWNTPSLAVLCLGAGIAALGGKEFIARQRERLTLLAGLVAVACFTAWTGSMDVRGNLVWVGFQFLNLVLLARGLPQEQPSPARKLARSLLWGTVLLMAVVNVASAAQRTADLVVWTWNPMVLTSDYEIQTEAFRGWKCSSATGRSMDGTVAFIKERIPPGDSLFVFPDVTMIYGLTGRDSYRKCPFIFQQNQLLRGRWYDEFREHFLNQPPQWIVLHEIGWQSQMGLNAGPVLRWLKLDAMITQRYRIVWRYGEFFVLRLATLFKPLKNSDFSAWPSSGTALPEAWSLGGDGQGQVKPDYAGDMASASGVVLRHLSRGPVALYQDVPDWERFRGGSIEVTCRVKSDRPKSVTLCVKDGVRWHVSPANEAGSAGSPSSEWCVLRAAGRIAPNASALQVYLFVDGGATASIGPVQCDVLVVPPSGK